MNLCIEPNFLILPMKRLIIFLTQAIGGNYEPIRIAHAGWTLLVAGCNPNNTLFKQVSEYLTQERFADGGWSDSDTSVFACAFLNQIDGNNKIFREAIQWLENSRNPKGGWGHHPRDRARIPTTALALILLPEAASNKDYEWIAGEWARELDGPIQLSYKAGFYLLSANNESSDPDLSHRTINYLANDQNDDGGFGPWKNHPIGSDPWSTGVVLWGLSKWIDKVDPDVIKRALRWLENSQLPSGYWPYHYLDEGTSYALIGAVSAMRAMASRT